MGCCEATSNENTHVLDFHDLNKRAATPSLRPENLPKTENQNKLTRLRTNKNGPSATTKNTSHTEMAEADDYVVAASEIVQNSRKHKDTFTHKSQTCRFSEIPQMKQINLPGKDVSYEIIKANRKLILKVIESKFLDPGTKLIINAGGLEGSERMSRDGVALFGNKSTSKKYLPNDFNFPDEEQLGNKHFEVRFNLESRKYLIKDLYGSGLFIRINYPIPLKNNSIFSFVNSHLLVKIPVDLKANEYSRETAIVNNSSTIIIKVLYGESKDQEYKFDSASTSVIKLGRGLKDMNEDPDSLEGTTRFISFSDSNISRNQCTITYDYEDAAWYLVDSDGELESMNGTWILADDYYEIDDSTVFRAGSTTFKCKLTHHEGSLITTEENIDI